MAEIGITLAEIAKHTEAQLHGDPHLIITGIAPLEFCNSQQISFFDNNRYRKFLTDTRAAAVILKERDSDLCPVATLIHSNPYLAYAKASRLFERLPLHEIGIHASATMGQACNIDATASIGPQVVIGDHVQIGPGAIIGAGSVIGSHCRIGKNSRLWGNVTIYYHCEIGDNAIVHSGAVIGSDGFGIANDGGQWVKIAQLGKVIIANDVEIGANTTIDRGALKDTEIGRGVKIDNQVHIAHNVCIGENTAIAGCVGISGGVRIGKNCMIAGGVGIAGHLTLGDGVVVTGMTLVSHSLPEKGVYSSGTALDQNSRWRKNAVRFRHLDEMARRVTALETQIQTLLQKESL